MIRVLIADDSSESREQLLRLLQADPQLSVVGLARDGLEAVQQAARLHPDVILMDTLMPRMDGCAATREIMAQTPTRIIMSSSTGDPADAGVAFAALEAGALTIVAKPRGT